MADIFEGSEATFTPVTTDYIRAVDNPTGTPISGNILISALATLFGLLGYQNNNVLINGGFTINQRVYGSNAALATGVYGHDRWKAGSGGGNYTFTQLASPTTITIAANKTLIQVVEDKMVDGGTYTLSWEGTCQGRVTINSATPSGAYAASPITVTGQTAGTTMSVEFGNGASTGTLGKVKLELGSVATPFVSRPYGEEWNLCLRYFERIGAELAYQVYAAGITTSTTVANLLFLFSKKRGIPVVSVNSVTAFNILTGTSANATTGITLTDPTSTSVRIDATGSGLTINEASLLRGNNNTSHYIDVSAEL